MTADTATRRVTRWVPVVSLGLALAAVAIASYLTAAHYTDPAALACPDTGIVNCALVTTSSWSVILGVPLAVLGLVWALVMAGLTVPWAWRSGARWVDSIRLALSGAGAAMVLYLVYVELFRVGAICLWCSAHAPDGRMPLRGDPGGAGDLVEPGPGPSRRGGAEGGVTFPREREDLRL